MTDDKQTQPCGSVTCSAELENLVKKWEMQIVEWSKNNRLKKNVQHLNEIEIRTAQLKSCIYDLISIIGQIK